LTAIAGRGNRRREIRETAMTFDPILVGGRAVRRMR
jgi:hypothetical protein